MGEVEGAMSALSIVIAGILTIVIAPLVGYLFKRFKDDCMLKALKLKNI